MSTVPRATIRVGLPALTAEVKKNEGDSHPPSKVTVPHAPSGGHEGVSRRERAFTKPIHCRERTRDTAYLNPTLPNPRELFPWDPLPSRQVRRF